MTTLANVKGYINGAEWGVYEPAPSLLTYEELITLTQSEAVTELNAHAEDYYTLLNDGGHWYNIGKSDLFIGGLTLGIYVFDTHEYVNAAYYMGGGIKYDNGTFITS